MSSIGVVTLEAAAMNDTFARSHSGFVGKHKVQLSVRYCTKSRSLLYYIWQASKDVEGIGAWVEITREEAVKLAHG